MGLGSVSGMCFLPVHLDRHNFHSWFYHVEVQRLIIITGVDFLGHHKLLVDLVNNHLVDAVRLFSTV